LFEALRAQRRALQILPSPPNSEDVIREQEGGLELVRGATRRAAGSSTPTPSANFLSLSLPTNESLIWGLIPVAAASQVAFDVPILVAKGSDHKNGAAKAFVAVKVGFAPQLPPANHALSAPAKHLRGRV
jgi:hypothetical protein